MHSGMARKSAMLPLAPHGETGRACRIIWIKKDLGSSIVSFVADLHLLDVAG